MQKWTSSLFASLLLCLPALASADRIAYSGDGNQHDPDDWHASPMVLAMLAEAGMKHRLVHFDYNNHLGDNDWYMAKKHRENVMGAVQRYGYEAWRFYDDQSNLGGAVSSIARAINASSSGDRLYLVCAGPMEVCYRGIAAAQDHKEPYVTVVSHSWWNDNHSDTWELKHKMSDIKRDFDVQVLELPDQNGTAFRSDPWAWDWLKQEQHGAWLHEAVARDAVAGDASDAGMVYHLIMGRTNASKWASMNDIKTVFADRSAGGDSGGWDGGGSWSGINPPGNAVGLKVRHSGKCVEVGSWSKANGGNVQQWSCSGYGNQKWRFNEAWGGRYLLRSTHSWKCAQVADSSWREGANVNQWNCHKGENMQFDLVSKGNGWFNLKAKHSNKCLGVAWSSGRNGANLVQQSCHGGWNQQFRFD